MTPASSLELALIGNCAISALVDRQGADCLVLHAPLRRGSDPSCRCSREATCRPATRVIAVELEGFVRSEQAYDAGTAVLRTRLFDAAGEGIEIVDFCPAFREP